MVGLHSQVNVAGIEAVVLGVGNRDEEGQNAEYDNENADNKKSFHVLTNHCAK